MDIPTLKAKYKAGEFGHGVYKAQGIPATGSIARGGISIGAISSGITTLGAISMGIISFGALSLEYCYLLAQYQWVQSQSEDFQFLH